MLTQNLAEKTFPLESCIRGGVAQSVCSLIDSSSPSSKPRTPAIAVLTQE